MEKNCEWCGNPVGKKPRTGDGWYTTCSESCRINMVDSIAAGNTAKFRTPFEQLIKALMPLALVALVIGFLTDSCSKKTDAQPNVEQTSSEPAAEATVEEEAAPEPRTRTTRAANESQHAVGEFGTGAPGEFESTTPSAREPIEPSDPNEPVSEENIQTIPAPEPDSAQ